MRVEAVDVVLRHRETEILDLRSRLLVRGGLVLVLFGGHEGELEARIGLDRWLGPLHVVQDELERARRVELAKGRSFRVREGRVEPLPATEPSNVVGFTDVDHDGRPDLLVEDVLHVYDGDVSGYDYPVSLTVAHSLVGGAFSTSDETFAPFVRRQCAGRSLESASASELFAAAGCARRLGVPLEEIFSRYLRRCRALIATSPTRGGMWNGTAFPRPQNSDQVGDYMLTPVCSIGHQPGQDAFDGTFGVPTELRPRITAIAPLAPEATKPRDP